MLLVVTVLEVGGGENARESVRLIIMRIRFRASDSSLAAKINIIHAKSKQASCTEMVLGSFVFFFSFDSAVRFWDS